MARSDDQGKRISEGFSGEVRKGHNAASSTTNRELPKGGSGTAPPKNQGASGQDTNQDKK